MMTVQEIEKRRHEILAEMGALRSMERATLKEQMLPVKRKDRDEPVMRGPYYLLARWIDGKTHSRRVPRKEVERVKQDVANHQRFKALCEEFAVLTEQLGELEREAATEDAGVKKKPKSRSRRAKKSSES